MTVTATDGTGSGSATFTWSVTNQWLMVTNPGTQTSTGGAAVSLQISAYDSAQLPLTYGAAGLPPGATIDPATGLISGTLDASDGGAYQATVMASDTDGNSGSAAFTWNVTYLNQPPTLAPIGDQLNKAGDAVSLEVDGSDVDGDTLTYSADGLPPGLSMDTNSGSISGTLSASSGSATPYSVTVTVSDGSLSASQSFNWYVTANVVTLTNPGDQTNTEGDAVTLPLSATDTDDLTLTYAASGLPSGLSINGATGVISGTVATGDAADGPYTVTVSAADTQGNSSAQQFTWTVNAPDHAVTLANPGDQSNAEGDTVSLQLQGSDPDGDTLTYAASGLPIGLWIDGQTGLIQGTVDYSAAEIAGGQYQVTVAVNDGNGDTATQSFVWTIADTEQGPWLADPGLQDNAIGDQVSLQLSAGSPDGKALTYLAGGLPAGLTVDPDTGIISGPITGVVQNYTVTASVSDGIKTASQTFTWQVASATVPEVLLSFDGQPVGEDYLTEVDPAVPVSVLVTLKNAGPGMHTIHIDIPSGESKLDQPTFQLADDGSKTIALTPEEESESFDDVLLVAFVDGKAAGDADGTNAKVTIAAVRNPDTPKEMKQDRIPPLNTQNKSLSSLTAVEYTITPTLKDAKVVVFQVLGNSATNGTAFLLNDQEKWVSSVWQQKSGDIFVLGQVQTAPGGNAGKLSIVAYTGTQKDQIVDTMDTTTELAKSTGFSVAAIPIKVTAEKPRLAEGKLLGTTKEGLQRHLWGAIYKLSVTSDSGNPSDLGEVKVSEVIVNEKEPTGIYKNDPGQPIIWLPASKPLGDNNGRHVDATPATTLAKMAKSLQGKIDKAGNGHLVAEQYFIFSDARTGVPANADGKGAFIVMSSGFEITQLAELDGFNYYIKVTRKAKANHGAKAGENNSSAEQKASLNFV